MKQVHLHLEILSWVTEARGAGGGGYSHTLPIRLCAAQRGRDFEAPDFNRTGYPFQMCFLERGIKNCGSRLYLL